MHIGGVCLSEYLIGVIGAVLVCSLLTAIIPNGKNTILICSIAKILCLSVIISPILSFLKNGNLITDIQIYQDFFGNSVIETDFNFIDYYSESTISYVEEKIEQELSTKYNFSASVLIVWEYEKGVFQDDYEDLKVKIKQMKVTTNERVAEEEKDIVWEFLTKTYCSEVLIE